MITINGKKENLSGKLLSAYFEEKKVNMRCIAVELNGEVVSKKEYDNILLKDGDCLEIVNFVGGG